MAWLFLAAAIALEITATFLLKLSDGFARWQWGSLSILFYTLCFWALAPALKLLPVGVVYAVWAGVGILGAVLLGWVFFSETLGWVQLGFIALIGIGAIGLRLTTGA